MATLSGTVEDFFSQPIPPEVWHYTSLAGLDGILSSGTIWATEARFTTDKTEFVHARDIAIGYLESTTPIDARIRFARDATLKWLRNAFDEGALSPKHTEVYVASFSAAADLKSQWADYADKYRGVSIAFDLRGIRPQSSLNIAVTLAPCVYIQEEKELLIKAALNPFSELVARLDHQTRDRAWVEGQARTWEILRRVCGPGFSRPELEAKLQRDIHQQLQDASARCLFDVLRLASHCKSHHFFEEHEWRLALAHSKDKPLTHNRIQYRGENEAIPYLASNLFNEQDHLPITQVTAGPLCDIDQARKLLERYEYRVPLGRSSIPLREPGRSGSYREVQRDTEP